MCSLCDPCNTGTPLLWLTCVYLASNYYSLLILKLVEHERLTTQSYEYSIGEKDIAGKTVPKQEELRPDENQLRGEADIYLANTSKVFTASDSSKVHD